MSTLSSAESPVATRDASQLADVVDSCDAAFIVVARDGNIAFANAGFLRLLGFLPAEVLGRPPAALLGGHHTDRAVLAALSDASTGQAELLLYTREGRPLWLAVTVGVLPATAGLPDGTVWTLRDMTSAKLHGLLQSRVLEALVREEPLPEVMALVCREVERIAPEVVATILSVDCEGCMHPLAGPSMPAVVAQAIDGLSMGPQAGSCGTAAWRGEPVVVTDIENDPLWRDYRQLVLPLGLLACWSSPIKASDGRVLGTFAFYYHSRRGPDDFHQNLVDISVHLCALALEREETRARIYQLAFYDALTGLPNRTLLRSRAERALAEAARSKTQLAVLFIDLDNFKAINDTQGHAAGDELLRQVARRLAGELRGSDLVGRLAGDEFVALLSHCSGSRAADLVERVLQALRVPVDTGGRATVPAASIGVALYPDDGEDVDSLLRHADMAMYQAKTGGRGSFRFFNAEMNRQRQERVQMEAALRRTLRDGGLQLHYQPQMRTEAGDSLTLHGVEALLRWHDPQLGQVPPMRFVALAEECGLIGELGRWVLAEACRQLSDWRRRGCAVPRVSVNLSASNFRDPALPVFIEHLLRTHALVPADLTLEMTESVMLDPDPAVLAVVDTIHVVGIRLSIDDFGTGFSSLSCLHRLPIGEIKLDRSFVFDVEHSEAARALTTTVLRIGESLSMEVVAEGVETDLQRRFLTGQGCGVLQGFLFAKPLSATAFEEWLVAQGPAAPQPGASAQA
ncbi:MAG: EAL domain-containing protein [Moraxellaceae bacterium]|nr:EAL domain-containing protein [Moraxellaceae bacterium]